MDVYVWNFVRSDDQGKGMCINVSIYGPRIIKSVHIAMYNITTYILEYTKCLVHWFILILRRLVMKEIYTFFHSAHGIH